MCDVQREADLVSSRREPAFSGGDLQGESLKEQGNGASSSYEETGEGDQVEDGHKTKGQEQCETQTEKMNP